MEQERGVPELPTLAAQAGRTSLYMEPSTQRDTAIVTGGGRGIGAACSKALAAKGFNVVVVYHSDASSAASVVNSIVGAGGKAVAMQADVGSEDEVVALFNAVDAWRESSPLRVLVNNAALLGPKVALQDTNASDLMELMRVNVAGPLVCVREAERRMSTSYGHSGGSIIQISSGSAYIGTPLCYAASKGALNSLTIGLVKPLAQNGIRINTVSPGMTATDMIADTLADFDMSQIPMGRVGTPEEIANAVIWLCSSDSSYVAGANIRVSGGRPPGTTLG